MAVTTCTRSSSLSSHQIAPKQKLEGETRDNYHSITYLDDYQTQEGRIIIDNKNVAVNTVCQADQAHQQLLQTTHSFSILEISA